MQIGGTGIEGKLNKTYWMVTGEILMHAKGAGDYSTIMNQRNTLFLKEELLQIRKIFAGLFKMLEE
mgnify:CR=1 FL=1